MDPPKCWIYPLQFCKNNLYIYIYIHRDNEQQLYNYIYLIQISIKLRLYSCSFIEFDSEIINIALVPDSSPVIFTNVNAASFLIGAEESCRRIASCFNISGSFNRSSRPSAVAVTPIYYI